MRIRCALLSYIAASMSRTMFKKSMLSSSTGSDHEFIVFIVLVIILNIYSVNVSLVCRCDVRWQRKKNLVKSRR